MLYLNTKQAYSDMLLIQPQLYEYLVHSLQNILFSRNSWVSSSHLCAFKGTLMKMITLLQ